MARFQVPTAAWLVSAALTVLPACQGVHRKRGAWPPDDFRLELGYTVVTDGVGQVRRHARIFADGLVVYREADESLRSADGRTVLPVFRRVSAYRMQWRSVRHLARALHAAPVKELRAPPAVPSPDKRTHRIALRLTYMSNEIDVVAENQTVGLMNRVVRIINAFLPAGHAITMPNMLGESMEYRLQDVPPVTDSIPGSKQFHERWLLQRSGDPALLRDAFALACADRDWRLAQSCIARLAALEPAAGSSLRAILADRRAAGQ